MYYYETISDTKTLLFTEICLQKFRGKFYFEISLEKERKRDSSVRDDAQRKRFKNTIIWLSFIYEQPWK